MRDTQYNPNKRFRDITIGKEGKQVVLTTTAAGKLILNERAQNVQVTFDDDIVRYARLSVAVADLAANTQVLVAAVPGYRIRMVGCKAEATVGDATTSTTVDVLATQTTSVKLVAFTTTALDRAIAIADGTSSGTVLNDGASYAANDANTAVLVGETGGVTAGATAIVFYFSYVLEA